MIVHCTIPQLNAEAVLHKCHMFVLEKLKRLIRRPSPRLWKVIHWTQLDHYTMFYVNWKPLGMTKKKNKGKKSKILNCMCQTSFLLTLLIKRDCAQACHNESHLNLLHALMKELPVPGKHFSSIFLLNYSILSYFSYLITSVKKKL